MRRALFLIAFAGASAAACSGNHHNFGDLPVDAGCTPSCDGRACGSDGCGGTCGECEQGWTCNANLGTCECPAESDEAFCARMDVVCGPASGKDACGRDRSEVACDRCASGKRCDQATRTCACPEADEELCDRLGKECGSLAAAVDACGDTRAVASCGTCGPGELCDAAGTNTCEVCTPQVDADFCAANGKQCGSYAAQDPCSQLSRAADCGLCAPGLECDAATNQCGPCTSETKDAFCQRLGKNCGSVTAPDNCQLSQTYDCGSCTGTDSCDEATNTCHACVPETDKAMCARLGRSCGPLTDLDNCGVARVVAECGPCAATDRCDMIAGTCVLCTGETDGELCNFYFKNCGTPTLADRCGVVRTPACGTCGPSDGNCLPNDVCGTPGIPSNDNCNTPERIVLDSTGFAGGTGDTTGADNGMYGSCGGSEGDIVFAVDLPAPKVLTITITPTGSTSASAQPVVYVRQVCNSYTDLGCAFASAPGQAVTLTTRALAAGTWYIIVDGYGGGSATAFTYSVTAVAPPNMPPNDTCATATALRPTNGVAQVIGDTSSAIGDYADSCSWSPFDGTDVVYKFTLAADSSVTARVTRDATAWSYYPAVELLSTCPSGGSSPLACGEQFNGIATAGIASLAAGDYYLVVDGTSGSYGPFTLDLVVGAPVTNDLCTSATAVALTVPAGSTDLVGSVQGDTTLATDTDAGACSRWGNGRDLAYSFTVPASGPKNVTIQVVPDNNSAIQPVLYVKTDCAAYDELACEASYSVNVAVSTLLKRLAPGTYYVIVDGLTSTSNGPFTLNITAAEPPPPPANDTCSQPEALALDAATGVGQAVGSTSAATNDYAGGCSTSWSAHSGPDVVYAVTLSGTAPMNLSATVTRDDNTSPSFRPAVYIQSSCADSATEKACGAENNGMATASATNLAAGTYYVVVDGIGGSAGDFTLDVVAYAPLTNDTCGSPTLIGFDLNGDFAARGDFCTVSNDTSSSGSSGPCWGGGGGGSDIVYKLVLGRTQNVELALSPHHGSNSYVYLRTDCATPASELACNTAGAGTTNLKIKSLPAGTYYVWLDNGWACGTFTFTAHVSDPPPAQPNDACAQAEALLYDSTTGLGSATGNTDAATDGGDGSCRTNSGPDLVYSFTLGAARTVELTLTPQSGSDLQPTLYVRSSCAAVTDLTCKSSAASGGGTATTPAPVFVQLPRLAAGTYYVFVDSLDRNASGPFDLQIAVIDPGAPGANDLCSAATPLPAFDTTTHKTSVTGNTQAGSDDDSSNCATASNPLTGSDLVYSFTLGTDAKVNATLTRGLTNGTYRPALSIRSSCARAGEVACALDSNGSTTSVITDLSLAAGTWYVFVDGVDGSYGPFTLEIENTGAAVAADTCGVAEVLAFNGSTRASAQGDLTLGATNGGDPSCISGTGNDLVYAFTTTADALITVTVGPPVGGTNHAPVVSLRRTCDDVTSELGCASTWSSGATVSITTGRMPAGTYYAIVDALGSYLQGPFVLTVDVASLANPVAANDSCAGTPTALQLDPVTGTAHVTGDTRDAYDDYAGSCATSYAPLSGGDLVYSVTLGQTSTLTAAVSADPATPNYFPAVYVRANSCASARTVDERGCFTTGWNALASVTVPNLPAGTYWIIVDGQRSSGQFALDVAARASSAVAPTNDSCASAQTLQLDPATGTVEVAGDTSAGASTSQGSSSCYSNGPELYYAFSTQATKDVIAEVLPGNSGYQPAVYIRSDCADPATLRVCDSSYGGSSLLVRALRLPAGDYTVVVDSAWGSASGPFILRLSAVDPPPPPTYDTCSAPQPITIPATGQPALVVSDSTLAANDDFSGSCATSAAPLDGPDVVYSFTLPADALVTAKVTPKANSQKYKAAVYLRASCASLGGRGDVCSASIWGGGPMNPTTVRASLAAGTTYFLIVDGVGGSAGDFDLEVSQDTSRYVDGDHCINARSIDSLFVAGTAPTEQVATVWGDNSTAGNDADGSCNPGSGPDLVYRFTLAHESFVTVDLTPDTGSAYYAHFYVRSTCDDPRSQLYCKALYGGAAIHGSLAHLPAGTYYLFVDGYSSWSAANGPFTAVVRVRDTPQPPVNDVCHGATALTFTASAGSRATVALAGEDSTFANNDTGGSCSSSTGNDLVYTFTLLTAHSFSATVTPGASAADFTPVLYLRRGSCTSASDLDEVGCNRAAGPGASNPVAISATSLPAGDYFLIVDGYRASSADPAGGLFDLEAAIDAPLPGPTNDSCAFAQTLTLTGPAPSVTTLLAQTSANAIDNGSSICGPSSGAPDVVYRIEVPTASQITVTVTPSGSFYPAVYLRHSCGGPAFGNQLACDFNPVAASPVVASRAYVAAGTYFVWVDGGTTSSGNASGGFDLEIALAVPTAIPPVNDTCDGGGSIPTLTKGVAVTGTTVNAFNDYAGINGSCGYWSIPGPEVVYAFTPSANGPFTVSLTSDGSNLMPWMSEGACGDTNACVMANDSSGGWGGVDSFTYPSGRAGVTYYIHVDASQPADTGTFTLLVQ